MAYKINGVVILDNSGNLSAGVASATEFDGKVSEKSISEQTDGQESDVTGADEVLIYDNETSELLRVTVDEFIGGAGIGTIVSEFDSLIVSGITTMNDHLIIDDSTGAGTEYALNVKTTGTSRFGVLGNGAILLGNSSVAPFIATNDHHATSKKYVDDAISSATFDNVELVGGPVWSSGTGSPEGVVTASVGSLYSRTDGGADTTLYVKESGTGNTGWAAK